MRREFVAGEHVLLVDDESDVLAIGAEILEDAGFRVARAVNADIALLLIKEGMKFRALVTDVVLPGNLDGFGLANLARALLPGLAVVYTTGFIDVARLRSRGGIYGEILKKPYRAETLINAVRAACGPRAAAA
jgi:DNA-binding NtrC family response regulator